LIGQLRNETILQHRALLPIVVFLGMGQWGDDRIARVLARLKPDEHRVAITYAEEGCAWAEAAAACGLPAEYGERVRRKLHRLGKQLLERTGKSAA
jgi:DNA-directed RNA polymerase specialized sigma24 family protein